MDNAELKAKLNDIFRERIEIRKRIPKSLWEGRICWVKPKARPWTPLTKTEFMELVRTRFGNGGPDLDPVHTEMIIN
jgi:hypothetical protein